MEFLRQGYNKLKASAPDLFHAKAPVPNPIASLNPYKMLLIGETGSGKTSFLNLICNFNLVQSLGFQAGLEQFHNFNDFALENTISPQMESRANDAKLYNVEFHDLKIGIIDTPGFGDSRGMDEDKRHVKRIIDALKEVDFINCVCLTINGRISRCTTALQYVLTEVTAVLPKMALDNVIVVFTNTADVLDLNFAPTELTRYFGREIKTYFCIENPYCKFEKARQLMGKLQLNMIAESLKKGFEDTGTALNKMYTTIKPFTEVHTFHFIKLYDTKQEIEEKVMHLLIAYDNQLATEVVIKKTQREIQEAADTTVKANAKSMKEQKELLLAKLNTKQEEYKKQMKLLSEKLLLTMEEFHTLGLTNNYARVLEGQIHVVKQRVQVLDVSNDQKDILRNTITELDKKLQLVYETLRKPWSKQADEKTQKVWAYKMLSIDADDDDHGPASIEQAYKDALANHKDDDQAIKRIKRAYEILS